MISIESLHINHDRQSNRAAEFVYARLPDFCLDRCEIELSTAGNLWRGGEAPRRDPLIISSRRRDLSIPPVVYRETPALRRALLMNAILRPNTAAIVKVMIDADFRRGGSAREI